MYVNLFRAACSLLFLCVVNSAFSQENENKNTQQADHSISQVVQARSCVNTFVNQTVSSTVSVVGCTTLSVQNVTVTGSGQLTLLAPESITINGPFEIKPGCRLNIHKFESQNILIRYTYDKSGNRITKVAN